ncbi:MAG: M1 family aminopeptidase, partial [Candidatus Marinimicrobia bacterium]|nr:M1 family aminopeptidase [Candidatus Neomarinimicrobiota bacterium]
IYFHIIPNAYASPRSQFYQDSENLLNEPLRLNIQTITAGGKPCLFNIPKTMSMVVVLPQNIPVGDSADIEIDYTLTIPEGRHPLCPSYSGSNFHLINFYPKIERLTPRGWTPETYERLELSCISPAFHSMSIRLPDTYSVVSSLDIDTVFIAEEREIIHRFQRASIRDLAIVFSSNQTVIPFDHGNISVQLMMPKAVERRFRLSKNTLLEMVTKSILDYYSARIFPYPHSHLAVTGSNIPGGVTTSNLIILGSKEIKEISALDYSSIHRYAQSIADQYFHYYIFEDPDASNWINAGLAGYAANTYMTGQYKSLSRILQIQMPTESKPADTVLRLAALAADQEKIGRPLQSPLTRNNTPLLMEQIHHYKSQKVLGMIHYYVGDSLFQNCILEFLDIYRYRPTRSQDFIRIVEEKSGKDLSLFQELWIDSENIPDVKIRQVKRFHDPTTNRYETRVITQGDALKALPVEIEAVDEKFDTLRTFTNIRSSGRDTIIFYSQSPLRKIALDPRRNIWEFNRLNNNYPSKILFNFLIAVPSIDAYQIFYYPTYDFNQRDLGRIGLKFRGRYWINMRPIFPSQSLDEWMLGLNYGIRSKTVGYDVSYSTSILALFFQPRIRFRSRDYFGLNETSLKTEIYIGKINYPLVHKIQGYKKLNIGIDYQNVRTLEFLNENNWQKGKLLNPFAEFINFHNWGDYRHITRVNFSAGIPELDTDYRFQKLIFDTQVKYRPSRDLWLYQRLFLGISGGQIPLQNYFYFFGKNTLDNMSFESFRLVKGAGDMRGYGAASPKGRNIITSNTEFRWSYAAIEPTVFDLIMFFDSGLISQSVHDIHTDQLKYDAGIGTEFNVIETFTVGLHIPFWVSHPVDDKPQFALRWVLSVDLNL